jgi:hypothetical protein
MLRLTHLLGFAVSGAPSAAPEVPDYANPGGTGDRTALITITADFSPASGTLDNLIDGVAASNSTDGMQWDTSRVKSMIFDFDPGNTGLIFKEITEIRWIQSASAAQGTWWWRGSQDKLQWTLLHTFGLDSSTFTPTLTGGYRYYQLMHRESTAPNASIWNQEVEFKIRNAPQTVFDIHTASYDARGSRGVRVDTVDMGVSTSLSTAASGGQLVNIIGGHMISSTSDPTCGWRISSNQTTGKFIKWDFMRSVIMTEWQWNQGSALDHHTWQLQGSPDNSSWTNVGSTFSFSGGGLGSFTVQTEASGNTTAYRYYRVLGTSGNTSIALGMFGQFEFKLKE